MRDRRNGEAVRQAALPAGVPSVEEQRMACARVTAACGVLLPLLVGEREAAAKDGDMVRASAVNAAVAVVGEAGRAHAALLERLAVQQLIAGKAPFRVPEGGDQ